jgi:hypothetical protein
MKLFGVMFAEPEVITFRSQYLLEVAPLLAGIFLVEQLT